MIDRLTLRRFGKFRERSFRLGAATAFYGPNESGKTTIFDALFKTICNPPRTRLEGRQLRERYGDTDDVTAELDGASYAGTFDVDEFLSLCAVRASDISLEVKDQAQWLAVVRAQLFAGGLDPQAVVSALDAASSDHQGKPYNRELARLELQHNALQRDLDTVRGRQDSILARESQLSAAFAELAATIAGREGLEARSYAVRTQQTTLERERRRTSLGRSLATLLQLETWLRRLAALACFDDAEWQVLGTLDSEAARAVGMLERERERLRDVETRIAGLETDLARVESDEAVRRALLEGVATGQRGLETLATTPPRRPHVRWSRLPLAVASACVLASAALVVAQSGEQRALFAAGGLALVALPLILASRQRYWLVDEPALARALESLRNAWNAATAAAPELQASFATVDGGRRECLAFEAKYQALLTERDRLRRALLPDLARSEEHSRAIQGALEAGDDARHRTRMILAERGVASLADYRRGLEEKAQLRRQIRERWPTELARADHGAAVGEVDLDSVDAARSRLEAEIRALGTGPLHSGETLDTALLPLEAERIRLEAALGDALRREAGLKSRVDGETGEIKGELRGLPQELLRLERALVETDAAASQIRLDKRAAALARDVFRELAEDVQGQMRGLADDIAELLAPAFPGLLLKIDRLSLRSIAATDAGGALRPLADLSSGTRDLFVLAARLCLALRSGRKAAALFLDDPFVMLDERREDVALALLETFQRRSGWQLVLLTKDRRLAEKFGSRFAAAIVHDLSGSQDARAVATERPAGI